MPGNTPVTQPILMGAKLKAACALDPAGALVANSAFNVASTVWTSGTGYVITFATALPSAVFYVRTFHSTPGKYATPTQTKAVGSLILVTAAIDQILAGERLFVEVWQ